MVKVTSSNQTNISQLEQEQIDSLRIVLSSIKYINKSSSLTDAKKKESAQSTLNNAIESEKEISRRLLAMEKNIRDHISLFPSLESTPRLKASVPFLNKYNIEEWLVKLLKYVEENNFPLAQRTIEEELLDPHFGMMSGRLEHTHAVEQILPAEERDEALAYNLAYDRLRDSIKSVHEMSIDAQYKEGIDVKAYLNNYKNATKVLFGKGFLFWKKGIIPNVEAHYTEDLNKLRKGESLELSPVDTDSRVKSLTELYDGVSKVHTTAFNLLGGNISLSTEQIEHEKKRMVESLTLFNTRCFNLIVPMTQREVVKQMIKIFNLPYKTIQNNDAIEEDNTPSILPDFVYEFFVAMESLSKEARQCIQENNYKDAVMKLEEIYRISIRREWERLHKIKESKAGDIVLDRVNDVRELVQNVRSVVRDASNRDKSFTQLILILEQTNLLLAAKKGSKIN